MQKLSIIDKILFSTEQLLEFKQAILSFMPLQS